MSKILKTGLIAMSALGSIASTGVVVANQINTQNVVEEYNYENQHIINIRDVYIINGEEVSYEVWTSVHENYEACSGEVLDEESLTFYYGALDEIPTASLDLDELTEVNLDYVYTSYLQNIKCGNTETEEGQYPVFVVPNDYKIEVSVSSFNISFTKIECEDYDIYYMTGTPTYDEHLGGIDYLLMFSKK